jgi:hypothetical protein
LERKHEIILCMAEASNEMPPSPTSEVPDGSQTITRGEGRDDGRARDAREGQEEPERPMLPNGYRVVAFASDAWVLIAPRGIRVAAYRGELDLRKVALDARTHHSGGE